MVLPAPFGPEQPEDRALRDLQVHVVDRNHPVAVDLGQMLSAKGGFQGGVLRRLQTQESPSAGRASCAAERPFRIARSIVPRSPRGYRTQPRTARWVVIEARSQQDTDVFVGGRPGLGNGFARILHGVVARVRATAVSAVRIRPGVPELAHG